MLPDTIRIGEAKASRLLLVRAIETEDRDAALLTADDRRYASHAALSELQGQRSPRNDAARFLSRRADIALERLGGRFPSLNKYVAAIRWPVWLSVGIPVAALLLGLSTDAFAGKRLNIVAFPLLGLIAWNLAVFAALAVQWLVAAVRPQKEFEWMAWQRHSSDHPAEERPPRRPTDA